MDDAEWVAVCRFEDLDCERGVAVLVHGRAVAVFRTHDGEVLAVTNRDPNTGHHVLARGMVGTRGDITYVASPTHLRAFDLTTGVCIDDPGLRISTYDVRVASGMVEVGRRRVG